MYRGGTSGLPLLGYSVASAGDVNGDGYSDLIYGVPADTGPLSRGSAVCAYGGPSGPTVAWRIYGAASRDSLGQSVACAGDVNGDGYSDVIAGVPCYSNGQQKEGLVAVFYGHPNGLSVHADWLYESNDVGGRLGWSVASAGDVNGDGYSDVIVGEPYFTPSQGLEEMGRALVFLGSPTGLGSTPAWQHGAGFDHAHVGWSVASAGDVNGDGFSDVIIGNPTDWVYRIGAGRAHVYCGSSSGLPSDPNWESEGDQDWEHFGSCVASTGDVNGDGYSDIIVGSPDWDADGGNNDAGAVRLYLGHPTGPSTQADATYQGLQASEHFGYSVAGAGDLNGDGLSEMIIGSPGFDASNPPQSDAGRATVYMGRPNDIPLAAWGNLSNESDPGAKYGFSVAGVGDCNGDGFADVAVGLPFVDNMIKVYFGNYPFDHNNTTQGLALVPRQQRTGGGPLDFMGLSDSPTGFRLAANGRSPYGRSHVRLEWSAAPLGTAFGSSTAGHGNWIDTGDVGASGSVQPLSELVSGLSGALPIHWQSRVATHNVYFPHSLWLKLPPYVASLATVHLATTPAGAPNGEAAREQGGEGRLFAEPNPFGASTRISFQVPRAQDVELSVFDAAGRLVAKLLQAPVGAGEHPVFWDGRGSSGRRVSSGIYYARLSGRGWVHSVKLTVAR